MTRKVFYFLSITWGLPLTICGAVVALFLLVTGHRPHRWGGCLCFEFGKTRWGGLNLGLVILCQPRASDALKSHEVGHAVQNALWGILTPFVVHFPSAVRFHIRNKKSARGESLPPYDAVWYEAQATRIGKKFLDLERRQPWTSTTLRRR